MLVTYSLLHAKVGITEWDLSSCSGKVPTLQQLLVQMGFFYSKTKVAIGTLRVRNNRNYSTNLERNLDCFLNQNFNR